MNTALAIGFFLQCTLAYLWHHSMRKLGDGWTLLISTTGPSAYLDCLRAWPAWTRWSPCRQIHHAPSYSPPPPWPAIKILLFPRVTSSNNVNNHKIFLWRSPPIFQKTLSLTLQFSKFVYDFSETWGHVLSDRGADITVQCLKVLFSMYMYRTTANIKTDRHKV